MYNTMSRCFKATGSDYSVCNILSDVNDSVPSVESIKIKTTIGEKSGKTAEVQTRHFL